MEVHHSHGITHKKKWEEYLLEFFMLFLAVFLGFVVENFREHEVEKHRTKKHMRTMMENLKYDTTRFGANLRGNLAIAKGLDSFRYQINEAIEGRVDANKLYYYFWKYGRGSNFPVINDAAMSQLKSSGLLRMVSNDSLVNEMGDYYQRQVTALDGARTSLGKRRDELNEIYRQFFSFRDFEEMLQRDTIFTPGSNPYIDKYYAGILQRSPSLELMSTAAGNFENLYNAVAAFELQLRVLDAFTRYCHKGAESLMRHINEEYEFEPVIK